MRAGNLDRTIIIEANTPTADSFGALVDSWATFKTLPAMVKPARGGEKFTAQQTLGKNIVTFKIRYRTDISLLHRISFDGLIWDIHDIRELGRREGLELDASARGD